jgi:hypothetical protein
MRAESLFRIRNTCVPLLRHSARKADVYGRQATLEFVPPSSRMRYQSRCVTLRSAGCKQMQKQLLSSWL